MGIFRTNDPTQFDDIDGIIIDEQTPPTQITGVAANIGILVGKFQRGPASLSLPISSIGEFREIYGKSSFSGNKQLKNKAFGRLKLIRVVAADAAKAELTLDGKIKILAKDKGAYGNNIAALIEDLPGDVAGSPGVAASFDAAIAGVTGNVQLSADNVGVIGNSILLTGDGSTDLATLVSDWNTANPSNTVTLDSANGSDIPDNAEAMQLAGGVDAVPAVNAGFKLTIKDKNADAVLGNEIYNITDFANLTLAEFAGSKLVDVELLDQSSGDPANQVETNLSGGSDGTIADTDYEAAIALAEPERSGNVLFLDEYNSLRNTYLKNHVGTTQDKMVICCGGENDDRAAAIVDAANYRDADGRIIYAWPYVETVVDGVREFTPPASWVASIFTQVSPHIALSYTQNTRFLAGITDLKFKTGRNGHISLDEAGVLALEQDPDVGFVVKNAVTTQILNSQKREVLRRRMADFLQDSIALALKNWQNDVNSAGKRDEVQGAILDFDARLVLDGILPGEQDVQGGSPLLVDTESLNTDSVIAAGQFKILYRRRIFSSMRYIVLQAEIGTNVVVTEV